MVTLNDYDAGFLGGEQEGQMELQKAMQAGQITGRDTANSLLTQEPLKVESLEKTLHLLEYRTSDIKLFNAMPKMTAYNTVEEFLQLVSYGSERGGFYDEGELSDVEDSKYMRKSELVKYMQVTGEVTLQAQMVRSYVDAMTKETQNKMMWIMRLANRSLVHADASVVPQEFNSIYKQHASVGVGDGFTFSTFEDYYKSVTVVDMRGASLKQSDIEDGAVRVDDNYGTADSIWAPTTIISALSKDYYERQRIILNANPNQTYNGNGVPKVISTTIGDISLNADKFMKAKPPKTNASPADNTKAPAAPTITTVALVADSVSKYRTAEIGNVYYAVAAINRYGESQLTIHPTAITITVGQSVDLTFTAGNGAISPSGYTIYRTKVTAAGSATGLDFFPIFKVSTAELASGFNGGAAGKIRDRGYSLPDTEKCFITQMDDEVMSFKQLAPISKLDLAVLSMSRRFITFLFGTPQHYAPKKMVVYTNVGKQYTA